jgi:peroxiredoxin (alkyl hydroperoxide reductase subunit C)
MSAQFFVPKNADGSRMRLPSEYRRRVKWLPQIGDIFPNFIAETTQGEIDFWSWAEGDWVFLFSHPAAKTPVCTTEIGALAGSRDGFEALGAKAFGLTGSTVAEQLEWYDDVEGLYHSGVWFPSAADPDGHLASLFGMCHRKEHEKWPIRKSFIIDPAMRIRMIFEYPLFVGRSIDETLRVIDALQTQDCYDVALPSDWIDGDPLIVPPDMPEETVRETLGQSSEMIFPYLRVVDGRGPGAARGERKRG